VAIGKMQRPDQYFLILDSTAVQVGENAISALNKLFCAHFVFAVEYFPRLASFYNFLEVLALKKEPKCSVRSLLTTIRAKDEE